MIDQELIAFLAFDAVVLLVTSIGFAIAFVRARERVLRERAERAQPRALESSRTDRIEQAIDAIAVEVERLAEAQRFTSHLLAERERTPAELPSVPRPAPERATTPH